MEENFRSIKEVVWNYKITDERFQFAYWNNQRNRSWIAQITGFSSRYNYQRKFCQEVGEIGKTRLFNLSEDGFYQVGFNNDKSTKFLEVIKGDIQEVSEAQVIEGLSNK